MISPILLLKEKSNIMFSKKDGPQINKMNTHLHNSTDNNLKKRLLQVIGVLYIADGVSLLIRGFVGGLFLIHESASLEFIIIFITHVYLGGAIYVYFGYGLLANKSWTTRIPGYILAISSTIWAIPDFGADLFTAILGLSYILIMVILRKM